MSRIITLIIVIILLAITELTFGEDLGAFKPLTKNFEVDELGDVEVEQAKVSKATWTLKEIDFYISLSEEKIKTITDQIKELKELRERVEKEAVKVKLKNRDGKES